jgi:hypothetical protein
MKAYIGLLTVFLSSLGASVARAEPSPARTALQVRSALTGLRSGKLPVFARLPGEGNDRVAARLLATLPAIANDVGGEFTEAVEQRRLRRVGRNWSVDVGDDGNNLRFRRITPSAHNLPLAFKPGRDDVEGQGRRVLATLKELMPLSAGEELVFMGTRYGYAATQPTGAPTAETEVVGWAAVFGRSVGGELVIGGGSIVAVLFNADGTVEGVDGDWPRYQRAGVELEVLPLRDITRRARSLRVLPAGIAEATTGFECGYFDPGGNKRIRQSTLQPACAERVSQTLARGERRADVRFVPAAKRPVKSPLWPELVRTCGSELCDEPAHSRLRTTAPALR